LAYHLGSAALTAFLSILLTPDSGRAQTLSFAHPGSLHTAAQLHSAATLAQSREPWVSGRLKLLERVEVPNGILSHAPNIPDLPGYYKVFTACWKDEQDNSHCPPESDGPSNMLYDADAAHTCALYWYVFKNDPTRSATAALCRAKAIEILNAWTGVAVGGYVETGLEEYADVARGASALQFNFQITGLLLAADIVAGGTGWAGLAPFRSWLTEVVLPEGEDSYAGNLASETYGPFGQNHGAWALYVVLLASHILHDSAAFNTYASELAWFARNAVDVGVTPNFIWGLSYNDATLGNERTRAFGAGLVYHNVSLAPLTSAMRVVKNVSGVNLFDALPDLYDSTGDVGKNIRRALQTFYYYNRHPDRYPYADPVTVSWFRGSLFDAMSVIYRSPEYANYAAETSPHFYDAEEDHNVFRFSDPHGTFLLDPLALAIDGTPPGTQTFETGAGPFSVRSGTWSAAAETGSPSGNRVYRQSSLSTAAATALAGDVEWLDYGFRARVRVNSFNGSSGAVGLFARYEDSNNYYAFVWDLGTRQLRVEKRFNGVVTVLGSATYSLYANAWYTFRVSVDGPQLTFRIDAPDGTSTALPLVDEFQSATRHAFLSGRVGLQAHRCDASFDNVCVARNGDTCEHADRFLQPSLVMTTLM
jgi:hypothetical protein